MDPRLRMLPSRRLEHVPDDSPQVDPVVRSTRKKSMKVAEDLVKRSRLRYGGLNELSRQRCFLGRRNEG